MKKVTAFFMALAMALGLAACGGAPAAPSAPAASAPAPAVSGAESAQAPGESGAGSAASGASASTQEDGKTLVVYYSATGNTEAVAQALAAATGGELFALEPADPYTPEDLNYSNGDSRVSREHDDPAAREVELVKDTVDAWEEYDTVFIGYPIWWGIAAWPVDGFIKANDFTGKTVLPFATSASSGLGQSGELLAELAGAGDWREGRRFSSGVSETDVQAWVQELGL